MAGFLIADIANLALDAIMWPDHVGDLEEGTDHANVILRVYDTCLRNLLRSAPWDFARKQVPLQLLADATGNTQGMPTAVIRPWLYEYEYPIDCAKARFIPWNGQNPSTVIPPQNYQIPQTPLVDNLGNEFIGARLIPARFLVATDVNYPPPAGNPQPWAVPGVSPQGRTVILTNVRMAELVYTARLVYPSVWDASFYTAFVAYLAAEIAGPIWAKKDPKMGRVLRDDQVNIVRAKVVEARANAANEGGPPTSDIRVDWMDRRRSAGPWGGGWMGGWGGGGFGLGDGVGWGGYDSLALPGGAVF